ncbi:DUF3761 domain-containing protein [Catenulispora pinisilvae]|uniref:DUF3761 domain-containing protein n=1 Tax=Catenulispora pinisilvae TaxID=2705253 RepID=UPI001E36FE3B|nr:DUF3761 domain-containing protein [Catenulispora pinisilvae]
MRAVPTSPARTTHSASPTEAAPSASTKSVAGCVNHATIGEGTARCGAGEQHPSGAMALCHDGSYSYSTTPDGTCSHHKGVEVWYY